MKAGVTSGDRFRSWPQILANAARAAGGLRALGVAEDDSVALMLRNDFATFEVNMAAGHLGAYAVPINWHFTPVEAGYILADSRAKVLVIHADLLAQIASGIPVDMKVLVVPTPPEIGDAYGVPAERRSASGAETWDEFVAVSAANPEPPKLSRGSMIYTSGTTGRPKGVRRQPSTPELQAKGVEEFGKYWGLVADPSIVVMMNGPMYHSAPAAYGMSSARLGLSIVLQPRFDAEDMLRLIDKHRRAHHVRATVAPARRGEEKVRPLLAALDHPRGRTLRAGGQARDDRLVGTDDQRVLRRHRDRHRGLAQLGRGTKEARHRGPRGRGRDHAYRRRARPRREARRDRRDLSARTAALRFHLQQRRRQAARDSARRSGDGG
jgi:hypothetical protein